jgi:hypothetical protein
MARYTTAATAELENIVDFLKWDMVNNRFVRELAVAYEPITVR